MPGPFAVVRAATALPKGRSAAAQTALAMLVDEAKQNSMVQKAIDAKGLEGVNVVVFDEFHERSINTDLALAMVRRVQLDLRSELKLIVMSAALAAEPIAAWLGDCPIVRSEGRTFPVDVRYVPHSPHGPIAPHVTRGIESLLNATAGDVLAFLPGVAEIRQTQRARGDTESIVIPIESRAG